jgi:hypothetical protein
MTVATNDVIGALESAKSFYQYQLDGEKHPSKEAVLSHDGIDMIDQIIATVREKITAIYTHRRMK